MNGSFDRSGVPGLSILAAAIVLGAFLVLRQGMVMQSAKREEADQAARQSRAPVPITQVKTADEVSPEEVRKIVEVPREVTAEDMLDEYEQEDKRPSLLQVFRMGDQLVQKRVEGVEYVKSLLFRRQVGTGRVLADVSIYNDSGTAVTPRFQVMLFNARGKFLCRDTVLYITEELVPGEKKIETMSLPHGPEGVVFYEVRKLE